LRVSGVGLAYPSPHAEPRDAKKSITRCVAWYRGTSLIRNSAALGPYIRSMPRALWES